MIVLMLFPAKLQYEPKLIFFWLYVVLENVVFEEHTREVDYTDKSVTGNLC